MCDLLIQVFNIFYPFPKNCVNKSHMFKKKLQLGAPFDRRRISTYIIIISNQIFSLAPCNQMKSPKHKRKKRNQFYLCTHTGTLIKNIASNKIKGTRHLILNKDFDGSNFNQDHEVLRRFFLVICPNLPARSLLVDLLRSVKPCNGFDCTVNML